MLEIVKYPERTNWAKLTLRPTGRITQILLKDVRRIFKRIRAYGDEAIREYTCIFDKVEMKTFIISGQEWKEADNIGDELKSALAIAKKNIETFHTSQQTTPKWIETLPGVRCMQKAVPIEKVGLYVPGGSAPLFSTVLMLAVPAVIAGCKEIVLCTPPNKEGKVHPAILFAAKLAGLKRENIFKIGGIQAIGAMTHGTQTVPRVYKLFGPGNRYVTAAKRLAALEGVAIDVPAGPSEAALLADSTANAGFIASDFLSQAEHGADSQSILVTTGEKLANDVIKSVEQQLLQLPREEITRKALQHSKIVLFKTMVEAIDFVNFYAPEHLVIQCENERTVAEKIKNAGSVFIGRYTPVSMGDYASGTNHTLPTSGFATAYSGVNLDSFVKKITFQEVTAEGLRNLGPTVAVMAENEGLNAHKRSVMLRLKSLKPEE